MPLLSNKITIGRIGAPHGLKGWLKIQSFTEPKTNICHYSKAWLQHPHQKTWQPCQADIKQSGEIFLIKLTEYNDPETARKLTGALLAIKREALPSLEKDEYYWSDLEGLAVITTTDLHLGHIEYFIPTGANDVMLVKDRKSNTERLIPHIHDVIVEVDLQRQEMVVNWDPEF